MIIISTLRFYFPNGNPTGKPSAENVCKKFTEAFSKYKNNFVTNEELGQVLKVSLRDIFRQGEVKY